MKNRDALPYDLDELIVDRDGDFRVNGLVYTDPAVFEIEIDRVFGRSWV